jgi:hypothetical protein
LRQLNDVGPRNLSERRTTPDSITTPSPPVPSLWSSLERPWHLSLLLTFNQVPVKRTSTKYTHGLLRSFNDQEITPSSPSSFRARVLLFRTFNRYSASAQRRSLSILFTYQNKLLGTTERVVVIDVDVLRCCCVMQQ